MKALMVFENCKNATSLSRAHTPNLRTVINRMGCGLCEQPGVPRLNEAFCKEKKSSCIRTTAVLVKVPNSCRLETREAREGHEPVCGRVQNSQERRSDAQT